jgi:hypothetical protein
MPAKNKKSAFKLATSVIHLLTLSGFPRAQAVINMLSNSVWTGGITVEAYDSSIPLTPLTQSGAGAPTDIVSDLLLNEEKQVTYWESNDVS